MASSTLFLLALCSLFFRWRAECSVVLITASNSSLVFPDMEASFAPTIPTIGIVGTLFAAKPLDACQPLESIESNGIFGFLLSERGGCDFVTKVKHAEDAGYAAAIIFNNEDNEDLITMSGSGTGIDIYAVFVSKKAGQTLQSSIEDSDSRCYLFPTFENAAKSLVTISFISLLTVFAIFSTLFFVRRHRYRRASTVGQERNVRGMAWKDVKALTVIVYDSATKETTTMCAICLEDYTKGEKLRVLPCRHEFHVPCIDQWLTTQRCFCPICKKDAHSKVLRKAPSENTPLLASSTSGLNTMGSFTPASIRRPQSSHPSLGSQHSLTCPMSQCRQVNRGLMQALFCTYDGVAPSAATCSCSSSSNVSASNAEEVVILVNSDE
eukprot:c15682_g1_i1 orf=310-1452(-)